MSDYVPRVNPVTIVFDNKPYTPPANGTIVLDFANAYDGPGGDTTAQDTGFFLLLPM